MEEGQFLNEMNNHEVMDIANRAKRVQEKSHKKPKDLVPKKIYPNKKKRFNDNRGKKPHYNNKFRDSCQTGSFTRGPEKF